MHVEKFWAPGLIGQLQKFVIIIFKKKKPVDHKKNMKVVLLTLTTLLAYVAAECPNACSGHGTFIITNVLPVIIFPCFPPLGIFLFFSDPSGTKMEKRKHIKTSSHLPVSSPPSSPHSFSPPHSFWHHLSFPFPSLISLFFSTHFFLH